MNKFIFSGYLGREPEIKTYNNSDGSTYTTANFSVGVTRKYKNKDGNKDTDWFNCSCTGSQAEFVGKYFHKGMKADCVGRVEINQGTNKEGQQVSYTNIRVEEIEFGERQSVTQANVGAAAQPQPNMGTQPGMYAMGAMPMAQPAVDVNQTSLGAGWQNIPGVISEDLPFN